MRFVYPAYLLLFIPLVLGLFLSFRHVRGMMKFRKRMAFALRLVLLSCIVLALAGPEAKRPNCGLCTIFIVDRSDSISEADYAFTQDFIKQSLTKQDEDNMVGIIAFGREPMVERLAGKWRDMGPIQSLVNAAASDLSASIRLACASFPEGKARRIVLISDGNETMGDAAGAASAAAADGIAIDHVLLGTKPREGEVTVLDTTMPTEARVDQPFDVRVVVDATKATMGTLVLDRDGQIVSKQRIRLNEGRNALVFHQTLTDPGFHRYRASVLADGDRDNRNNVGMGFVSVHGRPKILVLQKDGQEGPLAKALRSQGILVETYGPGGVPARPETLQKYDAVIFNDINAAMMTPFQMKLVKSAVRDSGIGFAMIGGEDSFLPGGYYGSPIADILPVDLNIRQRKTFPSTTICVVCDTSGSMGMPEDGIPKVRLVAKAAEQTVLLMSPLDRVGVAGSTDAIEFVAPIQKLTDKQAVISQVRKLQAGGGGIYCRPSLEFAWEALKNDPSKVRHLILMADGSDCDEQDGCYELADKFYKSKITMSVVSIGKGPHTPFLQQLAKYGRGRFYLTERASQLPAIFTQDAAVMSRSAIQEGAFIPKVSIGEDALRGIDSSSIPPLLAYCLTDSRAMAQVGMRTNKDDPLLATWQYGLATTMAFTSDAQARWAQKWVSWNSFSQFWAQAVRSIARRATKNDYEVNTVQEGSKGTVEIKALDANGNPMPQLNAEISVSAPSGDSAKVAMVQTAPGVFRGQFDANELGSYIVSVAEDDPYGGKRVSATGLSIPYPLEYRMFKANAPLMENISKVSDGVELTSPEQTVRPVKNPGHSVQELWYFFVLLAALLLPIDVGARRIAIPIVEAWRKAVDWFKDRKKHASEAVSVQASNVERLQKAKRTTTYSDPAAPQAPIIKESQDAPKSAPRTPTSSGGSAASRLLEAKKKKQQDDEGQNK